MTLNRNETFVLFYDASSHAQRIEPGTWHVHNSYVLNELINIIGKLDCCVYHIS